MAPPIRRPLLAAPMIPPAAMIANPSQTLRADPHLHASGFNRVVLLGRLTEVDLIAAGQ